MRIQIKRLPHAVGLPLPAYKTAGAAGFDFAAAIPESLKLFVGAGETRPIPTGFAVSVRPGFEIQVRPRSGLAADDGISVLNSPGTIDSDYRGEVFILLHNTSGLPFTVKRGMRIAQGVLCPVYRAEWEEVTELPETARGEAGFGSTGVA